MSQLAGKFVWFEHFSNDIDQARRFYESLVDWEVVSVPKGLEFYHLALNNKAGLAGFRIASSGNRAGWMGYLSVPDVDRACAAAEKAGARVLLRPTNFPPLGRGAKLADPTGAIFSIWAAALGDKPDPSQASDGDWCWNELITPDPEAAVAFYCKVFGFSSEAMPLPDGSSYHLLRAGGVQRAGVMPSPKSEMSETPAHWLPYLAVHSVDIILERGEALGAKVLAPARDIPQIGRFGVLEDPSGAQVAVFRGVVQA